VTGKVEEPVSAVSSGLNVAVSTERWRDAAGRIASGVGIVRTVHEGNWFGIRADAIAPLSTEPPILLVCLGRDSATGAAIDRTGTFVVDVLSEDQLELARSLGSEAEELAAPSGGEFVVQVKCIVTERVTSASHIIFLGLAESVVLTEGRPLTSYRGRFGRLEPIGAQR
jgi:flavin reductase (DIM6/NTAB) family NADH-FMN oxidoreductase RutF